MEIAALASVLGAMGAIIKLILTHLDKQRAGFEKSMSDQRAGFEHFLGNHMSANTQALRDLTRSVEKLADKVEAQ